MEPPSNMDAETKKFLYDDEQDESAVRRLSNKNINASERLTQITNSNEIHSSSQIDKSPYFNFKEGNRADMSPFGGRRRTYMERTFGPMQQGSVRGSIFALCAVAIGAGVLSLPFVLRMNGWVLGTILIIIGAVSGFFSMEMIL